MSDVDPVVAEFAATHPEAFARVLGQGANDQINELVRTLPSESVAAVAGRLPASRLLALLESGEHSPEQWLEDAPLDDAVMLLSRMRRERRFALINSIGNQARKRELLRHEQYPAHTAGALLQDVFLQIDVNSSLAAAIEEVRKVDGDDLPLMVVVNAAGHYAGVLRPWQLIGSRFSGKKVSDLAVMVSPISPETPITSAAAHAGWLDFNWLPVVDERQRVLGALSRKAIIRAAGQASTSRSAPANLTLDLLGGVTLVLGEFLEDILARRST